MASVTALQLVNRTRLYRRQPTVAAIATDEDSATLNAINTAIENILGTRKWEFDLRHDGQFKTRASLAIESISATSGSTTASLVNTVAFTAADLGGDYITRLLVTADTEYANTPFRITAYSPSVSTTGLVIAAVAFPNTILALAGKLLYSEYLFPDTVRSIVRMAYQEDELNLEQLSPITRFDEWLPNSSVDTGEPETVAIGGFDNPTYSVGFTPVPKLRAIVWPVPDDAYIINYSYYYRHPELTVATSTLDGVPPEVVNDIVEEATSLMGMVWDSDYAMSHLSDRAQMQANVKHRELAGNSNRRNTIRSWSGSSRSSIESGFPGKVIG